MKKTWMIAVLMITVLTISGMTVQAKNNFYYMGYGKNDISESNDGYYIKTVNDLNLDGKSDVIESFEDLNDKVILKINSIIVKTYDYRKSDARFRVGIGDLITKDKYKELFILEPSQKVVIYRYNGESLVKYTSSYKLNNKKHKILGKGCYSSPTAVYGNGKYKSYGSLVHKNNKSADWGINFSYKVVNGNLMIDTSKVYKIDCGEAGIIPAATTMYAYKYPRTSSNKLLFTLRKNQRYTPLKIKLGKKYSYVYVRSASTKQKGWILLRTADLYWRCWN